MSLSKSSPELTILRQEIESAIGKCIKTPRDFEMLSDRIVLDTNEYISPTTLKRIWNYISGGDQLRLSTLNILSGFIGYKDWGHFLIHLRDEAGIESDFLQKEIIRCRELAPGASLHVCWLPNRRCRFKYLGEERFEVIGVEHSKLQVGDTFTCSFFIKGEPIYLDNLKQEGKEAVNYIAGTKGGLIDIEVVESEQP